MKIARLDLKAFGPFTDEVLDLSAGACGLHLVYGPNEAGKSSALRALNQLLYGILPRTSDDFEHPYGNLRIGGLLTNGDGSCLEILRRKANKNDLRGPDDNTIVEPGALGKYLGELDRETFEAMFGIDHAALVRGGREIVAGKGSLGQVLFAAGSGIADLKSVQEQLEKDAADLFSPAARAKNPKINARLAAWEKARKDVADAQLPSSEWERHDKALRQAQKSLQETEGELAQARVEQARLQRIHQAVPLVVRLRANAADIEQLGPVKPLSDKFGERRRETVARLSTAETISQAAVEAIAEIDAQIARLTGQGVEKVSDTFFDALLRRGEAIEQLAKDLGSYRKAQRDLRETVAPRREQAESDARRLLRELRPDLSLDDVETLRVTRPQRVEIQNLGNRYEAIETRYHQATDLVSALSQRLSAARHTLASLPPPRNADLLKNVLRRAASVGRIEEERAAAAAALESLEEQASASLARLPLWRGTLDALEQLALPSSETIDAYESRLAEAERQVADLKQQLTKAQVTQAEIDGQLEQAARGGAPPEEIELAGARSRRDEGWRLVRSAWLEAKLDMEQVRQYTGDDATVGSLADVFQHSIEAADHLADQLRRDADRVAARAALLSQRQACLAEQARLSSSQQIAAAARDALLEEWQSLWRPLGVDPQTPREMRGWERKVQALLQQAGAIRNQRSAVTVFDTRMGNCRQELNRALEALDEPTTQAGESLAAQLERAQRVADHADAAMAARQRLSEETAAVQRQLEAEQTNAATAERELNTWKARWTAVLAPLGLPGDATPAQANEVLAQLDALFEHLAEADSFQERIAGIAREAAQFTRETELLFDGLGRNDLLAGRTADQAADALLIEYRQATEDRGRLETLRKQREKQAAAQADAKQAAAQARAVLQELCREAGCDDAERLPELEEQGARSSELRACERNLQEQLSLLSGGQSLAEFVAEVGRVEADQLPNRLEELRRRVAELEVCRDTLLNTVTLETKALADMDASAVAAEAEEQAQSLAAEIVGDVESYVRLRLASAVLRAAIERYREKNQGPVLERASRLFAQLTVGSFSGLRADYNERGEAVLVGVRGRDGRAVTVEGMSEGTADQLYLALRLASLENYLNLHEPAPLIVDDILVNFDNQRSLATLDVLGDLSRRTQVIFFTHHEHLVALAREHLEPDVVFVHELHQGHRV
ncbi:MAG TPA: AAA family ATPase [Pirellulales bacterium]|nr:AAA family ATPase [Pirellulales bacterium]